MWHKNRVFGVTDVADDQELLDRLKGEVGTWCLCQGWRCQGYLWLNDALSEDGAQEYAVVREADMMQIESVTVSWMDRAGLAEFLRLFVSDGLILELGLVTNRIQTAEEHGRCQFCA